MADAAVPAMILLIVLYGHQKGVAVFDVFLEGAKEGIMVAFRILPALVGLLTSISMLKMSGGLDLLVYVLTPLAGAFHIPPETLPLALLRPLSGSGSLAVVADIFKSYGPDGFIGRCASVMMGSTETTFYTIAVYFGSVGIEKTRHTVPAALCADLCGMVASVFFVRLLLGGFSGF